MPNTHTRVKSDAAVRETVVDTDFHVQVPAEKLVPYISDDDIRRKVERFGIPPKPSGAKKGKYASEDPNPGAPGATGATTHGRAITTDEIVEVKEQMALDYVIATPPPDFPFAAGRYPLVLNELIFAYNEYVLENVIEVSEGIFGLILFPRWDMELATAEIEEKGSEEGVVGVSDHLVLGEPLGATRFDPLFETVVSMDLPIVIHHSGETLGRRHPLAEHFNTGVELSVAGTAFTAVGTVVNMIMSGVFDKFPNLEVLIQEAGVNWIPTASYRTDEKYQHYGEDVHLQPRIKEASQKYLQRMPSEYVFENFYVTTQPISLPNDATASEGILKSCKAEEMFLFSTDWPHGSVDTPDWVFDNPAIDDDLRETILHKNAFEFLELGNLTTK